MGHVMQFRRVVSLSQLVVLAAVTSLVTAAERVPTLPTAPVPTLPTAPAPRPPAATAPATQPAAPSWMSKPSAGWPQLLLSHNATFKDKSTIGGASAFLMRMPDGIV